MPYIKSHYKLDFHSYLLWQRDYDDDDVDTDNTYISYLLHVIKTVTLTRVLEVIE